MKKAKKSLLKTTVLAALLTLIFSAALSAEFVPGYQAFRYFTTPGDVKNVLQSNNQYNVSGLIEGRAEIYHDVYVKQEFVYFYGNQNQFLQFSFASNILDLKRNSANRIVHLGMRNAKDFMTLTLPSGSSTKFPDWEYRFVFYNHTKDPYTDSATNAFKLFAISLSYAGIETNGDFRFVEPSIIQKIEKEMHQIYGQPAGVAVTALDSFTKLYFKSYMHEFNGSYLDPYNIKVQVNLSYTLFTGKLANLQLTYLTSDLTDQLLTRLSRVAYEESPRSGNPLPLK